jgi:hypothetical protein
MISSMTAWWRQKHEQINANITPWSKHHTVKVMRGKR